MSVSDFVMGDNYLSVLSTATRLEFDKQSDVFAHHPLTTDELKECFQDIKVLGPREINMMVKWREKMRKFLDEVGSDGEEGKHEKMEEDVEANEQAAIDAKIELLAKGEAAEAKRCVGVDGPRGLGVVVFIAYFSPKHCYPPCVCVCGGGGGG